MDGPTTDALVAEATKRSGLIWVRREGSTESTKPLWHTWVDGSVYLLTGSDEQVMPDGLDGPGARAEVTVASKDKGQCLAVWLATVTLIEPGSDEWALAVPALRAKRLNSVDGEDAPERWARSARRCGSLRRTRSGRSAGPEISEQVPGTGRDTPGTGSGHCPP